ncbi:MAG: DegT/DnrJ/EryC1/StrS family aminotransferase [Treponema sp.]|nr:DegT/DnrJ/EryC1/StrS family aminotransferase [Treponema sp.]
MIQTYSTTIRRKEMDAVLTCMVDERIGPGELNARLIQQVKLFFDCDGAVALRSPETALKYAIMASGFEEGGTVMISALAPSWHYTALENLGYKILVLDVDESSGLVNAEIVQRGINHGGRLLLLHESMGILPKMDEIMALGIPVIEDVSKSAGALVPQENENGQAIKPLKAGSFGVYSILALEERDVITSGGGAVLMAPNRREWIVLKKFTDLLSKTELLPDINCALAWVQLKEFQKNEESRKQIFSLYQRACMSGRHKMFSRSNNPGSFPVENTEKKDGEGETKALDYSSTMSAFPLVLSTSFKDVKQYTQKKEIEISQAYEDSVIALKEEDLSQTCIRAKSLFLRTAVFPLYPRLTHSQVAKIVKVLGTLP